MQSILIDSNVLLDVMTARQPFFESSSRVIDILKNDKITGYISATSITDIYYISRRELKDKKAALQLIKNLLKFIKIAAVSENEIQKALDLDWNDFEDAVQYSTALLNQMDFIVTRNVKDFKFSEIPAITPEDFCKFFEQGEN